MSPGRTVDQLRGNPHSIARLANTTFQRKPDSEVPTHLRNIYCLVLVDECRVACDDEQPRDFGQVRDDVLADSITEIFLLQIATHVGEWEDHDRGAIGERRSHGKCIRMRCAGRRVARSTLVSRAGSQCRDYLIRLRQWRFGASWSGPCLFSATPSDEERCPPG